jgi:hypothetical protein
MPTFPSSAFPLAPGETWVNGFGFRRRIDAIRGALITCTWLDPCPGGPTRTTSSMPEPQFRLWVKHGDRQDRWVFRDQGDYENQRILRTVAGWYQGPLPQGLVRPTTTPPLVHGILTRYARPETLAAGQVWVNPHGYRRRIEALLDGAVTCTWLPPLPGRATTQPATTTIPIRSFINWLGPAGAALQEDWHPRPRAHAYLLARIDPWYRPHDPQPTSTKPRRLDRPRLQAILADATRRFQDGQPTMILRTEEVAALALAASTRMPPQAAAPGGFDPSAGTGPQPEAFQAT